jgi:hypothetical protein
VSWDNIEHPRFYRRVQDAEITRQIPEDPRRTTRDNPGKGPQLKCVVLVFGVGVVLGLGGRAWAAVPLVEVRTSDVELFYRIYNKAHGAPSGQALQHGYIDAGSDGVRQFLPHRIESGENLAETIAEDRDVYDHAQDCLSVLPALKAELDGAFRKLAAIDPEATFPPVTILVGRNNSAGTTGESGVLIGLEAVCRASWLQPDLTERLYHLIAHEYGHVEQFPQGGEDATPDTVLKQSLVEGGAELIAELISGQVSNVHLQQWARGREREIDEQFLADQDSKDLSPWLYKGPGTPDKPGDLGYWVGYRIAKAYYLKASDKRRALKDLLELKNPKAILANSGWMPGHPN